MSSNEANAKPLHTIAGYIGIGLCAFALYREFPFAGMIPTLLARKAFFMGVIIMVYLLQYEKAVNRWEKALNALFLLSGIASIIYLMFLWAKLRDRMGIPITQDLPFCFLIIIVTLDVTRKRIGWPLVIIAALFILYARYGHYVPIDLLKHAPYSWSDTFFHLSNGPRGIWAIPLGVIVDFVFLFIIFGNILLSTGAIDYIIKLACFLTKNIKSGPAMMAVLGSGLFGSISGSTLANAATTGNLTIPLMKSVGYPPETAAGIETSASIGGQWMPPVMGASAFIMAALLGIPYLEVIKNAAIPAVLFYISVASMVVAMSSKYDIKPMPEEEYQKFLNITPLEWLISTIQIIAPISILIYFLMQGYSPSTAAGYSIIILVAVSIIFKKKDEGAALRVRKVWDGFLKAGFSILPVAAACASAGLILGVVVMTGAAVKFTALIVQISGGNILIAMLLVMLASLFLGMGVPVTAAYIIVATVAAPALSSLGVAALIAHLCSFWYAIDSEVTPPVCVTSYTTAGIADADPWKTALQGWKCAKGLYIIPLLVVTSPLIPVSWGEATTTDIVLALVTAVLGLFALSVCLERHFIHKLSIIHTALYAVCCLLLFLPYLWADMAGIALWLLLILYTWIKSRAQKKSLKYASA